MDAARFLIVDDDDVDRMAVQRALRRLDVPTELHEVTSAEHAIRELASGLYDCAFLDYMLPDGSGLEVVRAARAAGSRTPIVILTGQGDERTAVELMKAGATDYVPKGAVTPERIQQCARHALRLVAAERAAMRAEEERSRLYLLERQARAEAEAAQRRIAYLAEASSIVSSSLDFDTTLGNVARLAVPTLADWCFVDLAEDDGGFTRVAVAHRDEKDAPLAARLRRRYGPMPDAPHGVGRVISTGTPEMLTELPDWVLLAVARDAEHLEALRHVGLRSTMCIPLIARGRTLGAMTFIANDPARRYSFEDLALAEEIGRRAALAVDNARLYHDAVVAEERLRRQLEFTSAITASLAEGVCAVDAEGRVTFANPAAATALALAERDLVGRSLHDVVHRHGPGACALQDALLGTRVTRSDNEAFHRADGVEFPTAYSCSPILRDGKPTGAVLAFHDVSERRRAEERLHFQAGLLEAVQQAIIVTSPEGVVTYWNRAAEGIYGYASAEAAGRPLADLLQPTHASDEGARALQALVRSERFSGELALRRKDGSTFPAQVSTSPLHDKEGRLLGLIGVSEDITDRKRAESELEASRRHMAMSEKLSALGTLVSGVAHEIRTPLTYLANNLFLAQHRLEATARQNPALRGVLDEVLRFHSAAMDGVDRANALVKDLRAFVHPESGARIEAGLHDVVHGAVELFRATQRGSVTLEADLRPTPRVLVDKGQLQRVVINLLVNAAEAMPPGGGAVRVRTRAVPGGAEIEVEDEGLGVPPEIEARMFDPFFTTKAEGTGLGLSIVQRIVHAHGGSIRYTTRLGQGTRFVVFLPAAPSAVPVFASEAGAGRQPPAVVDRR